jgi:hypothetical protein
VNSAEPFLDLEIRIGALRGEAFPVELVLAGEQTFRGEMAAELDPAILFPEDPRAAGEALFQALLAGGDLRRGWERAFGRSQRRRIRLNVDPAARELHRLSWELLRVEGEWLAASAATPFSRYLPVERPWGRPAFHRPLRLLVVVSSPLDLAARYPGLAQVDEPAERRAIQDGLGGLAGDVQVAFLDGPATLSRLEERLQEGFAALHVTGHGALNPLTGRAAVLLQDEGGQTRAVTDEQLTGVLARLPEPPRLVFLMACQSAERPAGDAFAGLAPRLVAAGVPAVLAMQGAMSMPSGQRLAEAFYRRLAAHGQVDQAVNEARSTLVTAGRPDAHLPVLFMRLVSGRLWEEAGPTEAPDSRSRPGRTIHTGGGVYIEGNVNTGGGDFVGRDKISYGAAPAPGPSPFRALRLQVARLPDPETRAELEGALDRLEAEAAKGPAADEQRVLRWLTFLEGASPELGVAARAAFRNPDSRLPGAFRRAAEG